MLGHDADHTVGRERLRKLWPNAWVNLVFVESGINRAIGSLMEKNSVQSSNDEMILLNLACLLRVFLKPKQTPLSLDELKTYVSKVRRCFLSTSRDSNCFHQDCASYWVDEKFEEIVSEYVPSHAPASPQACAGST